MEAKSFEDGLQFAKDVGYKSLFWKATLLKSIALMVILSPPLASVGPKIYGIQASCHDVQNVIFVLSWCSECYIFTCAKAGEQTKPSFS